MKDAVTISGRVFVTRRIGRRVIDSVIIDNLVTTVGKNLLASIIGASGTKPTHMAVGTGYTDPAVGNTTLEAETARVALTATTVSTNTVQYAATFGVGVGTGTIRELGLLNAGSGGTLSNRAVPSTPISKTASMSMDVVWQLTIN